MDDKLLKILACPDCKANVFVEGDKVICSACGKIYAIKNGIPVLLVGEAEYNS